MRIALHESDIEPWVERSQGGLVTIHCGSSMSSGELRTKFLDLSESELQQLDDLWFKENEERNFYRSEGVLYISRRA
jgi:hypothetical protein